MSDEVFQGLPIWHAFPGSLSERAGLKRGDIVIFANGRRVDSLDSYVDARSADQDTLELTVLRGRELLDVRLDLRSSDDAQGIAEGTHSPRKRRAERSA